MVCEKTPDSLHDFSRDPLQLVYDGEWLKAKDTTLGADNGVAVAIGLAVAGDKDLVHPPLELLFTVSEEIGLTGAKLLEPGFVRGEVLLNLDSDTEGEFTVGCAGGRDTEITLDFKGAALSEKPAVGILKAYGMRGGHSGADVHKQRANANNILARALRALRKAYPLRLVSLNGGSARNAIPRESEALIALAPEHFADARTLVTAFLRTMQGEFAAADPALGVSLERAPGSPPNEGLSLAETDKAIGLLLALPFGVAGMSAAFPGTVETSSNLATVELQSHRLKVQTNQRSAIMSRLDEITEKIEATASLAGARAASDPGYPAWQPTLSSPLLERSQDIYRKIFKREPVVKIMHAGLECGVIGAKYPGLDMISFGPTIRDPHSPDEKLHVPSLAHVWDLLAALLASYA
jgi:dipeptidase D